MGEEFDGVDVGEGAVRLALADRGAYGFDDDCVTHGAGLLDRPGGRVRTDQHRLPVSRKSELTIALSV
ncbi:hypothetical protein GCM10010451_62730 [Streptomyces virens]|uniref:Uncharacterized protein n=1 Tax=Streptomyces virens TaxID=285572 RepID=A0ABP6Q403_9ACTN